MEQNSLKELNPSQLEAVTNAEGPLLVLAGPGSGKTRVISHRIAYLINNLSIPPEKILAVTFTNKAAKEMKKRVEKLAGEPARRMWIGTFHSICLRILKTEADFLEGHTRDFVVYDQDDQLKLLKTCLKELDYGERLFSPRGVLSEFDRLENRGEISFRDDFYGRAQGELYNFFKKKLVELNAMTFNDLLLKTNGLLVENEEVRLRYQNKFSYVLVDEYQDTNTSQYLFVQTLSRLHQNIFVVGDDSQSIYCWRGADIDNILSFERDFPSAKVIKLERNYRSTATILSIANEVVRKNFRRKKKTLWTENPPGEKPVIFMARDQREEARFVAEKISRIVASGDFSFGDIAIFYRANFQSRIVEEVLRAARIGYRIVSGVGFFQRAEIKDLIAYLRLVQNPRDDVSFERIVNVPPRKIGQVAVAKLREVSTRENVGFFDAIKLCEDQKLLAPTTLSALSKFEVLIKELCRIAENCSAGEVMEKLLERVGYLDYIEKEETRIENVKELLTAVRELGDIPLCDFLDSISLATDEDRSDNEEKRVSLMTIHAAKGLEFPAVFLIGLSDGLLPHHRSTSIEEIEEERRLFYVAITRAKKFLNLSHSYWNGQRRVSSSPFLDDIPREYLVFESARRDLPGDNSESSSELDEHGRSEIRKGASVSHKTFGPGVVRKVEEKGGGAVVTVDFSGSGTKKVLSSFLEIS